MYIVCLCGVPNARRFNDELLLYYTGIVRVHPEYYRELCTAKFAHRTDCQRIAPTILLASRFLKQTDHCYSTFALPSLYEPPIVFLHLKPCLHHKRNSMGLVLVNFILTLLPKYVDTLVFSIIKR